MMVPRLSVDYPLRDPSLGFLWFTLAGALTQFVPHARHRGQVTASDLETGDVSN